MVGETEIVTVATLLDCATAYDALTRNAKTIAIICGDKSSGTSNFKYPMVIRGGGEDLSNSDCFSGKVVMVVLAEDSDRILMIGTHSPVTTILLNSVYCYH